MDGRVLDRDRWIDDDGSRAWDLSEVDLVGRGSRDRVLDIKWSGRNGGAGGAHGAPIPSTSATRNWMLRSRSRWSSG